MSKVHNVISNIANKTVEYGLVKPLQKLSTAPGMGHVRKEFCNKNLNFMNGVGIASIILKDGLGCYMYVKQSLNNEKIPADKRKFVAALDLANGGLMIAMQILLFLTISSKAMQKKMFKGLYGKYFSRGVTKGYQAIIKQQDKYKNITGKEFQKGMDAIHDKAVEAFSNITSLVAATIIGKRVIVPFIATPLADKTKEWMCRNDKPEEINSETKNTYCKEKHDHRKSNCQPQNPLTAQVNRFTDKIKTLATPEK